MSLLEDKRFIREGRSIREWILDLASEHKDARDKASQILYDIEFGEDDSETDSVNSEEDDDINQLLPKAIAEAFNTFSSPEIRKMLKVIERSGQQYLGYMKKAKTIIESDNNEIQITDEEAKDGHYGGINLDILKYAGVKMHDAIDLWIQLIEQYIDNGTTKTASEALGNMGPLAKRAFPVIFKKMCVSDNPHHYAGPAAQIIKDDLEIQNQIILSLRDPDLEKVSACLLILLDLDTTLEVLEPLMHLARRGHEQIRGLAIQVLGKFGKDNEHVRELLLAIIKTETGRDQSFAMEALAKTCSNSDIVVPIMIAALTHEDYYHWRYEGCVRGAAVYLLEHANKAKSMEPFNETLPILLNEVKKMAGVCKADDDLEKIQLLSKFGPKAKKTLPKLKRYLKSFLEDDPKAKEKTTRILKQAVEAIEKG